MKTFRLETIKLLKGRRILKPNIALKLDLVLLKATKPQEKMFDPKRPTLLLNTYTSKPKLSAYQNDKMTKPDINQIIMALG